MVVRTHAKDVKSFVLVLIAFLSFFFFFRIALLGNYPSLLLACESSATYVIMIIRYQQ
jgi:hypothetical protein